MPLFRILSLLMALLALAMGWLCFRLIPRHPQWAARLPRHRTGGMLLGTALLAYCAYEGGALLPGTRWPPLFWALVPMVAALSWKYLDFLFARAMGGLWIALANYLIQHAFAYYCAWRPLYALVALLWGCAGMAAIAWPWLMRDALQACQNRPAWRWTALAASLASALLLALLPFLGNR